MTVRMIRVKGSSLIVRNQVSNDVMEGIRSKSGSGSYVIVTSRGKG